MAESNVRFGIGVGVTDLRVVGVLLESSVRLGGQASPPVQPPTLVLIVALLVQAEKLLRAALHVAGDRAEQARTLRTAAPIEKWNRQKQRYK